MLRCLIEGLRERAPLRRSESEMATLLDGVCAGWSLDRPLLVAGRGLYADLCL